MNEILKLLSKTNFENFENFGNFYFYKNWK